ncbi:carboxypeptidase-like regulatory domain-containing protein [Pyxidicoccus sp. MSG2]|uniref:carboxypeptidase-like regulatory domain-containing protein n=1 Tax=Pyxidicoccus sp. MSG2 TaxID=2996790 RepID=UPI00226DA598|nr:carboxypeptidase-like regulatory domain-containing protein [Pyxidicoccus sp. MSG2]MCY1018341.1 carboxypeptidase-like regulatory domain-containing protein [Pyxidicoccus sp. MSG2]
MKLSAPYVLCSLLLLFAVPVLAQSEAPAQPDTRTGMFIGTVIDVKTRKPASDVVVIAFSPNLHIERATLTDEHGNFRMPLLPPGMYTLRFEHPDYELYQRPDIQLRPARTVRARVELLARPPVTESEPVVNRR